MLSNYSWSEFIMVIGILMVLYYFYVILRYYRTEFIDFLSGKYGSMKAVHREGQRQAFNKTGAPDVLPYSTVGHRNYGLIEDYPTVQTDVELLMENIKQIVLNAAQFGYSQEHLLKLIQDAMKSYPSVNEPMLRASINEFIQKICEDNSVALLAEEDVDVLWDDLGGQSGSLPGVPGR